MYNAQLDAVLGKRQPDSYGFYGRCLMTVSTVSDLIAAVPTPEIHIGAGEAW